MQGMTLWLTAFVAPLFWGALVAWGMRALWPLAPEPTDEHRHGGSDRAGPTTAAENRSLRIPSNCDFQI